MSNDVIEDDSIAFAVKRRRTSENASKTVLHAKKARAYRRKRRLLHLPEEILYLIFRKFTFKEISKNLMPICKRFQSIGINMLNIKFYNIENECVQMRLFALEKVSTNLECTILAYRIMQVLDILMNQYDLIRASIWRYSYFEVVANDKQLAIRSGELLDQIDHLFDRMYKMSQTQAFMDVIPSQIKFIQEKVKQLLERIEKHLCKSRINSPFHCGCKIIDLLDCSIGIERKVVSESYDSNTVCNLKMTYSIDSAWLTCLLLTNECKPHELVHQDLRFMFKRICRIIRAHNSTKLHDSFLDSESSTFQFYCGYGEICDKFYFYGTISKEYKSFSFVETRNVEDDEELIDLDQMQDMEMVFHEEQQNNVLFVTDFQNLRPKLKFEISVKCPLHLAPWFILERYNTNGALHMGNTIKMIVNGRDDEASSSKVADSPIFDMSIIITSTLAADNHLPCKYKYSISQNNLESFSTIGEDVGEII